MQTLYTVEGLEKMTIAAMKAIAADNGLEVPAGKNKVYRATWIDLLTAPVAGTVTAEEFATFEDPAPDSDLLESVEDTEIEQVLLDAVNAASDAEQAAIMAEDLAGAQSYGEQVDRLLEQYERLIEYKMQRLAINSIPVPPAVNIIWASPFVGSVSIDSGETFRAFRVIDAATDSPVVLLQTSAGAEIDSRWITTAGNRYIKAVFAALPDRLASVERAMFTGADLVPVIKCSDGEGNGDGEGPRGGRGDGSDRGRLCLVERGGGRIFALTYDVPDGF